MKFTTNILALSALASSVSAAAAAAAGKSYYLKTQVISGNKTLNNLYLAASHSGAGFNDAVLLPSKTSAAVGYLVQSNSTPADGHAWYNQQFNIGSIKSQLVVDYGVDTYAGWQPTFINSGSIKAGSNGPYAGFFPTKVGLQYNEDPADPSTSDFDGWLVCQWWRGVPQLFFKIKEIDENITIPGSCASVYLILEYI